MDKDGVNSIIDELSSPYGITVSPYGRSSTGDRILYFTEEKAIKQLYVDYTTKKWTTQDVKARDKDDKNMEFDGLRDIVEDTDGNIFVVESKKNRILKLKIDHIHVDGQNPWKAEVIAGSEDGSGDVDGLGTAALFNHPWGICFDSQGNLLVTDTGNNKVKKLSRLKATAPKVATEIIAMVQTVAAPSTAVSGNTAPTNPPASTQDASNGTTAATTSSTVVNTSITEVAEAVKRSDNNAQEIATLAVALDRKMASLDELVTALTTSEKETKAEIRNLQKTTTAALNHLNCKLSGEIACLEAQIDLLNGKRMSWGEWFMRGIGM